MSALTVDRSVPDHKQVIDSALFVDFPVAATTVIFAGGFVGINAAGNLIMHTPVTLTSTADASRFVGIAQEHIASQTAAGDKRCKVQTSGYFKHALSALALTDVGKSAYVTDSATLAKTGVSSIDVIARCVDFVSTGIGVFRLNEFGTGPGEITRSISEIELLTADSTAMLLHESENHNGAYISDCAAVYAAACDTDSTAGILTIVHTTNTTTGVTITSLDNDVDADLLVSSTLGKLFGIGTAKDDNMILIPADKAIRALVTTQAAGSGSPTCILNVVCKIILL